MPICETNPAASPRCLTGASFVVEVRAEPFNNGGRRGSGLLRPSISTCRTRARRHRAASSGTARHGTARHGTAVVDRWGLTPTRPGPNVERPMYIAPVDAGIGEDEWRSFVAAQGFGHLAASGKGRDVPVIVPTQFVLEGDQVLLHLVASNPVFSAIEEQPRVVLSVAGDWAFIPSAWKAVGGEDPRLGIPTTYYAAVQLTGTAEVVDDPGEIAGILRVQLATMQPGVEVADPLEAHADRLRSITGLRIALGEVRAKFKYGGNVDAVHRLAVAQRLRERGLPGDVAAAAHTLRRLGRDHVSPEAGASAPRAPEDRGAGR